MEKDPDGNKSLKELFVPDYERWQSERLNKLKGPIITSKHESDPILNQYRCPISNRLIMFPVEDKYGHLHDFYEIKLSIHFNGQCSLNKQPLTISEIKVRKDIFDILQSRLKDLA